MLRNFLAEAIGTFALVLVGTGAVVVNDLYGGAVTHVGICLAFGFVVMTMIYTVGDISGAHLNPAVTLGFWVSKRLPGAQVLPYVLAQCLGAVLASGCLRFWFPAHAFLGATLPSGGLMQSFSLEVVLSFFLMYVILSVSDGAKEKGLMAGVAVGATVAFCALFGGPVSGASMNPARSLGPAVIAHHLEHLWIYFSAPVAGALLAVACCKLGRSEDCCTNNC